MELLYDTYQQLIKDKLSRNELLTLSELNIIIKDINTFKLSQLPDIDIDTKNYCLDKNLINNYISKKYSDSIYYLDKFDNIHRFYV